MAGYISGDTRKVTTPFGGNEAERRENFYAYLL